MQAIQQRGWEAEVDTHSRVVQVMLPRVIQPHGRPQGDAAVVADAADAADAHVRKKGGERHAPRHKGRAVQNDIIAECLCRVDEEVVERDWGLVVVVKPTGGDGEAGP